MNKAKIFVLAIAVASGGAAAMLAGREPASQIVQAPLSAADTVDVLVARSDIAAGRALAPQDVEWQPWPTKSASDQFVRKTNNGNAREQIGGAIARTSLSVGEPIREAKLIRANGSGYMAAMLTTGMRAIATEITPESGAAGFILPNDHVDVILTSAEKSDGKELYRSRTILMNVRVLAIDQNVEEKSGQKVAMGKIATLELDVKDSEKLSLARRLGSISLILRGLVDQSVVGSIEPSSLDRADGINVVRYGQTMSR